MSLLQHRKWRNTEKYAQTPLEESKNITHQHYQAIALHMWKVGAVAYREKKEMLVSLHHVTCVFLSPGGEEAF